MADIQQDELDELLHDDQVDPILQHERDKALFDPALNLIASLKARINELLRSIDGKDQEILLLKNEIENLRLEQHRVSEINNKGFKKRKGLK